MVTVRTGQIRSAREVSPDRWDSVVADWVRVTDIGFPDDCRALLQMREECRDLEMYKKLGYESETAFFREALYLNPDTVDLACQALEMSDPNTPIGLVDAISATQKKISDRVPQSKYKVEVEGKTQQQAADELGVDRSTVTRDMCRNTDMPEKMHKPPRQRITYQIQSGTKPATAAQKILEKFGDQFALDLADKLLRNMRN